MYYHGMSLMFLYIKGNKNGRMMLESIKNGPLVYPTVKENGQVRNKKYVELTEQEKLQDDCDVQATTIVLQSLPPDVYALVNHCQLAKDIWERVKLLMKGFARIVKCYNCQGEGHMSRQYTMPNVGIQSFYTYYIEYRIALITLMCFDAINFCGLAIKKLDLVGNNVVILRNMQKKRESYFEVHGAAVYNEDEYLKFLEALTFSWNNVALFMRKQNWVLTKPRLNVLTVMRGLFVGDCRVTESRNRNGDESTMLRLVLEGLGYDWSYIAQDEPTEFALMDRTSNLRLDIERQTLSKANLEIVAYQLGLESVEAQLIVHQKNEAVYEEKIAVLEFEVKDKGNAVTRLTNQLEQTLKEKEDLKAKLEQFETSSKNLNKLINSQISSKDKTGLGYGDQLNENDSSGSELFNSVFDSRSSDGDDNQTNDRFKKDNEYHAVPPPLTGNYMPPLADLSFAGLDDSVYRPTTNKTSASVSQVETSITPPSNTSVEMPRVESVRPSGVIIEDWVSDDDEDIFQSEDSQTTVKPSFKKIEFTKARNEPVKSDKQAVKPRMVTQSPKVDRKDWNGKMTQKLGLGFGFTKKACFVCGSHNHLIKDCDFHEKRMPKESVLGKGTGHREVRPIWNNTQRINHQNKFVPTTVLTRSGRIPVSTAKRYLNTATPKNRVNVSKSKINTFSKSHSPIRRPFYKSIVLNTRVSKVKVNTIKVNGVNTVGQTAICTVKGNGVIAVKASADSSQEWLGSPRETNSLIFVQGNPQQALKYKGMFDSRCSRHMTGNKTLLTDYQDIDGGFVAFGRSTRGGKITGLKQSVDAGQSEEKNVLTQQLYRRFPHFGLLSLQAIRTQMKMIQLMILLKEATKQSDAVRKEFEAQCNRELFQGKATKASNTNSFNTVSTLVNAASASRTSNDARPSFVPLGRSFPLNVNDFPDDPLMPDLRKMAVNLKILAFLAVLMMMMI
ncbi:ribonuclease H-like domain-containing protein [Tanacetum coccineum]